MSALTRPLMFVLTRDFRLRKQPAFTRSALPTRKPLYSHDSVCLTGVAALLPLEILHHITQNVIDNTTRNGGEHILRKLQQMETGVELYRQEECHQDDDALLELPRVRKSIWCVYLCPAVLHVLMLLVLDGGTPTPQHKQSHETPDEVTPGASAPKRRGRPARKPSVNSEPTPTPRRILPSPTPQSSDLPSSTRTPSHAAAVNGPLTIQPNLLQQEDPPIDIVGGDAVTNQDWRLIKSMDNVMKNLKIQFCDRCHERWFQMQLDSTSGVCARCRRADASFPTGPYLMSAANHMNPGSSPPHLPALTAAEEMLVACIDPMFRFVLGRQTFFAMRSNVLRRQVLPPAISTLGVFILHTVNPVIHTEQLPELRVARWKVEKWLDWLVQRSPAYKDTIVDRLRMEQLPLDGTAYPELSHTTINHEELGKMGLHVHTDVKSSTAFMPQLILSRDDILPQPSAEDDGENTPLLEAMQSGWLISATFPMLFPSGQADFSSSRLRSVDYPRYVEHLLKYDDGRFAAHTGFRQFSFITSLIRQNQVKAAFLASHRFSKPEWDLDDIRAAFEDSGSVDQLKPWISAIVGAARTLRGSKAYWNDKMQDLKANAKSLGGPHLLLTVSHADIHWHSLHRHFATFNQWETATGKEKTAIAEDNIESNPCIVAYHFLRRVDAFMQEIVEPKFGVCDWWYRYEWQNRGASHIHCVLWVAAAPPPVADTVQSRDALLETWRRHLIAWEPQLELHQLIQPDNVLSQDPNDRTNTLHELACVVRQTQIHRHSSYCHAMHELCRFGFPFPLLADARFAPVYPKPIPDWRFEPCRNDHLIVKYNRTLLLGWTGNMDLAVCTSSPGVISYVSKSSGKCAVGPCQLLRKRIIAMDQHSTAYGLAFEILMLIAGARDWCGEEVCHMLLGLPLQAASRGVVNVDCRPREAMEHSVLVGRSTFSRYITREPALEQSSYIDFLRGNGRARILRFMPIYDHDGEDREDFCRVKMMLNHAFRNLDDLRLNEGLHSSWENAYQNCLLHHWWHADDGYVSVPELDSVDSTLAADITAVFSDANREHPSEVGSRDVDQDYDWSQHDGRYPEVTPNFWDMAKASFETTATLIWSQGAADRLNSKQREVYDLALNHETDVAHGTMPKQLLLQVDGEAGVGKSHLIAVVSAHLLARATARALPDPVIRAAPTGVAAYGISGQTIHTLLALPTQGVLAPLTNTRLDEVRRCLAACKYIFLDEKSMIGLHHLSWIDKRMRQVFDSEEAFGGVNIILCGDFYQLPPVACRPLYWTGEVNSEDETHGQRLYMLLSRQTVHLTDPVRHQGLAEEDFDFRSMLSGLRNGELTVSGWDCLQTRLQCNLPSHEIQQFDDALHIYHHKRSVEKHNNVKLLAMSNPAINLKASYEGLGSNATMDESGGLPSCLTLCIGARVMLTENIWVEQGLVNGALGYVQDIVWRSQGAAFAVMVKFDKYNGSTVTTMNGLAAPIFRSRRNFTRDGETGSVTQFPLTVAYAITTHKAQGITVDRAVLDISEKDFIPGLTYVAISRVKKLANIMLKRPFDFYSRFGSLESNGQRMRRDDAEARGLVCRAV